MGMYTQIWPVSKCENCIQNCEKCEDDKRCLKCFPPFALNNDKCVELCPEGFLKAL